VRFQAVGDGRLELGEDVKAKTAETTPALQMALQNLLVAALADPLKREALLKLL
jgi:hypothetical protein